MFSSKDSFTSFVISNSLFASSRSLKALSIIAYSSGLVVRHLCNVLVVMRSILALSLCEYFIVIRLSIKNLKSNYENKS